MLVSLKMLYLVLNVFIIVPCNELEDNDMIEQLFGIGSVKKTHGDMHYIASSTSDLARLFEIEKELIAQLKQIKTDTLAVSKYLEKTKSLVNLTAEEYVFHPVNMFHLIKRTAKWFPMIHKSIPGLYMSHTFQPNDMSGPAYGLAAIQEFYNFNVDDLIQGVIKDPMSERVFKSIDGLTSTESLLIADEAKEAKYLEGHVSWVQGALKKAISEKESKSRIKYIRKRLKKAIKHHDSSLKSMMNLPDQALHRFKLREVSYNPSDPNVPDSFLSTNQTLLDDLEKIGDCSILDREDIEVDAQLKIMGMYRRRIQELCRGTFQRPPPFNIETKCFLVTQNNPFLRLGPFKYEMLSKAPEVGLIHQLLTDIQSEAVIENAKPYLKPTPYIEGKKRKSYSKLRTSKVMYMNERKWPTAMQLSNLLQNATGVKLYYEKFASENFQVMNYGIGGKIDGHWDTFGADPSIETSGSTEAVRFGGGRFITMMAYLTDVKLGGRTIFPQAGISVQPEKGSVLYWFSSGPQNNMDSRALHLGCPLLIGNKWIANKWAKWIPQQKRFPCSDLKEHYSIFD